LPDTAQILLAVRMALICPSVARIIYQPFIEIGQNQMDQNQIDVLASNDADRMDLANLKVSDSA
jgi:hypothetical protein